MSAVDARINYEGTEEGAEQIDGLLRRLVELVQVQTRAERSTDGLEDSLRGGAAAAGKLEQETKKAAAATDQLSSKSASAEGASSKLGQTLGQAGGAAGNLGSIVGRVNPQLGQMGGLVGQLGAAVTSTSGVMGPWGIAIAGVTAAVTIGVTVLEEYRAGLVDVSEEAETAAAALANMVAAVERSHRQQGLLSGLLGREEFVDGVQEAETEIALLQEEVSRRLSVIEGSAASAGVSVSEFQIQVAQDAGFYNRQIRESVVGRADAEREIERVGLRSLQVQLQQAEAEREILRQADARNRAYNEQNRTLEDQVSIFSRLGDPGAAEALEGAARVGRAERERRARRPRGARRPANDNGVSEEGKALLEAARLQEEAAEREQIAKQQLIDLDRERLDLLEAIAIKNSEITERELEAAMELAESRKEAAQALAEKEDELAQKRLADARQITGAIEGTLQQVASAYIDAFGAAIEGQKTLEQASLEATKGLLKTIGEQMVAIGIRETLEGFANIVSSPPVAATKIPMGIALIAGGAALGAAGAAIPSQPAAPAERPRGDTDRRGGEGGQTLNMFINSPMISTGTHHQLTRQLRRQMRDGQELPTRVAA